MQSNNLDLDSGLEQFRSPDKGMNLNLVCIID